MNVEDIMAVVVSYNGRESTRRTVLALSGQVGHIHIIDNGSEADSLEILDSLAREHGVSINRLGENRGIGHALNLGVAYAKKIGCTWLLTMDQDSTVDNGLIKAYQSAILLDRRVASLSPRIGKTWSDTDPKYVNIDCAITSGNLVRIGVFEEIGPYDEGFFIDCIDFDFSLRLRRAGYKLLRVQNTEMQHQLGEPRHLPAYVTKFYAQHSAARRYYQARNYLYLAERHLFRFPAVIIKLGILRILLFVLIVIFDQDPRDSCCAIARGLRDYVARRNGPYHGTSR
jgi:rhamnosyltransferase